MSDEHATHSKLGTELAGIAAAQKSRILEVALNAIDQGFVVWDENDCMIICNDRFREFWNYPKDIAKPGVPAIDLLRYDAARGEHGNGELEDVARARDRTARDHHEKGTDEQYVTGGGRVLLIRRYTVPELGTVSTFTDITDLKMAEDALKENEKRLEEQVAILSDREGKLEAQKSVLIDLARDLERARNESDLLNSQKDKFFSIIAHDLMGPFNLVLGYSDLLAEHIDDFDKETVKSSAQTIRESGYRLSELLENLLSWSRHQMGRIHFEPLPTDLNAIIARNLDLFRPLAEQKAIRLIDACTPSILAHVDHNMVDMIIRNLINNAIKFTDRDGEVTVETEMRRDCVAFSVADTGVGISADKMSKLFLIEEKTSTTGTDGETGTGLGLQLCKEFVERQGGEISVASVEGEGSRFTVTFPLASATMADR